MKRTLLFKITTEFLLLGTFLLAVWDQKQLKMEPKTLSSETMAAHFLLNFSVFLNNERNLPIKVASILFSSFSLAFCGFPLIQFVIQLLLTIGTRLFPLYFDQTPHDSSFSFVFFLESLLLFSCFFDADVMFFLFSLLDFVLSFMFSSKQKETEALLTILEHSKTFLYHENIEEISINHLMTPVVLISLEADQPVGMNSLAASIVGANFLEEWRVVGDTSLIATPLFTENRTYQGSQTIKEYLQGSNINSLEAQINFTCVSYCEKSPSPNLSGVSIYNVSMTRVKEKENVFALFLTRVNNRGLAQRIKKRSFTQEVIAASMSHDLRTPINSNNILGQVLLGNSDSEVKQVGSMIVENCLKASITINSLVDFFLLKSNTQLTINVSSFLVSSLIAEVSSVFALEIELKNLVFVQNNPNDIKLETDYVRLKQIIVSLLSNAIKFTTKGWIKLNVRASSENNVRFEIEDSGCGMTEAQMKNLFLLNEDLPDLSKWHYQKQGAGFGLSVAKMILGKIGPNFGNFEIQSKPKIGTKVSFEIFKHCATFFNKNTKTLKSRSVQDAGKHLQKLSGLIPHEVPKGESPGQKKRESRSKSPIVSTGKLLNFIEEDRVMWRSEPKEKMEEATKPKEERYKEIRVLVVDDDRFCLLSLTALLKKYNFSHVEGSSVPKEALDMMRKKPFDLMFIDYTMPEMTGLQLIQKAKTERLVGSHAGVILVSAVSQEVWNFVSSDFDEFLEKPFTFFKLGTVLEKVIEEKGIGKKA